jgi:hypothetical protein
VNEAMAVIAAEFTSQRRTNHPEATADPFSLGIRRLEILTMGK